MSRISEVQSQELVSAAMAVREMAYAPYSKYRVGAAVLTADGSVFTGCNVENASYGLCICAERTAIAKMVSQVSEHQVVCVCVATADGGSPCGACRQVMSEFGTDFDVMAYAANTQEMRRWTIAELLPDAFRLL